MTAAALDPNIQGKILSSKVYPKFFRLEPSWTVLNLGCGNAPQAVIYKGAFRLMAGVDIQDKRLKAALETCRTTGTAGFHPLRSDVEALPFRDSSFDAVLAIDILEHARRPRSMLAEVARVLKPGGRLLVTFPAFHDRFRDTLSYVARNVLRLKPPKPPHDHDHWDPDEHQEERSVAEWRSMVEERFRVAGTRATTMFPPLHLYGVPRVWFKWGWLHALDSAACRLPGLKGLGQTLMCLCEKP